MTSSDARLYIGSVKWRNQLLALSCLAAFLAFGVLYFRYWVVQKPFGIILFLAEDLDAQTIAAARIQADGKQTELTLDSLPYVTLLNNASTSSAIPDMAAAATAVATGTKVRNGTIAVDASGRALPNLFDLARASGRMTGLITTGRITAPAPASFYAHARDAGDREALARQLVEAGNIDLVFGGGGSDFTPLAEGGTRQDDRDLLAVAREAGYELVQSSTELESVPRWRPAKLFGFFAGGEMVTPAESAETRGDQPKLADMVRRAIELLQFHRDGYLLVVNATASAAATEEENGARRTSEIAELDRAISVAMNYTGNKAVIFVYGITGHDKDHGGTETAATPASDAVPRAKSSDGLPSTAPVAMETNPSPEPRSKGSDILPGARPDLFPRPATDPPPKATDALAFAEGLRGDALQGRREDTSLFQLIRDDL